jgi:hypothetical protein
MTRKWTVPAERASLTPQQRTKVFLKTDGHCADCGLKIDATRGQPFYCAHNDGAALWQGNTRKFYLPDFRPLCEDCWIIDTGAEAVQRYDEARKRSKAVTGRSKAPTGRGFQTNRDSRFKLCMNGDVIDRETGEVINR